MPPMARGPCAESRRGACPLVLGSLSPLVADPRPEASTLPRKASVGAATAPMNLPSPERECSYCNPVAGKARSWRRWSRAVGSAGLGQRLRCPPPTRAQCCPRSIEARSTASEQRPVRHELLRFSPGNVRVRLGPLPQVLVSSLGIPNFHTSWRRLKLALRQQGLNPLAYRWNRDLHAVGDHFAAH